MLHASIQVSRTAHYYALGVPGPAIRRYWLVCHGYAQLADEFLQSFRALDDGHTLVVAPEGLNYFYKKGFGGPPGATWMTRQHREDEIRDYTAYLAQLNRHIVDQLPADVQIVLLGFSQGAATVCRWILRDRPLAHALVLWAGFPPEDEDLSQLEPYWRDKQLHFAFGHDDAFITPDRMELIKKILADNRLAFQFMPFEGGHDIPEQALSALVRRIG
jgi:predicted esterase